MIDFQRRLSRAVGRADRVRVLGGPPERAAEVEIVGSESQRFRMAAFWRQRDGLLQDGIEYWVTVGSESPPPAAPPRSPSHRARWTGLD